METTKEHIKSLIRVQPDNEARQECLRLDLNENIIGLPEEFVAEVLGHIDAQFLATYPQYQVLREKIGRFHGLDAEEICLANGSDGAIKYLFDAYVSAGDKILVTDPTFAMYNVYGKISNAHMVPVSYHSDFAFPMDEFTEALSADVKIAVIVNPNNPTGTVVRSEDMRHIISVAERNNVLLLVDEAYHYFCDETAMPFVHEHPNVLVLRTFSKLCAVAATRIGYAAGNAEIIKNMEKVKPTYDVNGVGVLFADALVDRPAVIRELTDHFRVAKSFLAKELDAAGIAYRMGDANFVLIDVGSHSEVVLRRLRENKILVGGNFSQPFLAKYIRVTIGDMKSMELFLRTFLEIRKDFGNE